MINCKNSPMLAQARQARFRPKWIIQILLFLLVFWVGNSIASLILTGPVLVAIFTDPELLLALTSGDVEASVDASFAASMSVMEKPLRALFIAARSSAAPSLPWAFGSRAGCCAM